MDTEAIRVKEYVKHEHCLAISTHVIIACGLHITSAKRNFKKHQNAEA